MMRFHRKRDSSMKLAEIEVSLADAGRMGVLGVDPADRVTGFVENLRDEPPMPGSSDVAWASMGSYVFNTEVLLRALEADATQPTSHDFGKDIIPALIKDVPTFAYRFYDENKKSSKYWRDIGTLDAYYEANMDLCFVDPEFNLYDPEWPMRTYQPQAPPAKFVFAEKGRRCGEALDSIISPGCIVSGSTIVGSVLCPTVRVNSYATIDRCILIAPPRVRPRGRPLRRVDRRARSARAARRRQEALWREGRVESRRERER